MNDYFQRELFSDFCNSYQKKKSKGMQSVGNLSDFKFLHKVGLHLNFTSHSNHPVVKANDAQIPKRIKALCRLQRRNCFSDVTPHFYVGDAQFNTIWTRFYSYLDRLRFFPSVIGPDFSTYSDWLLDVVRWNIFRNKFVVALLQYYGIEVIPNVSWSLPNSYEFAFEGLPQNSVIAVNSTCIGHNKMSKTLWMEGYKTMMSVLHPKHILRYGAFQDGEDESISTYYENDNKLI